MAITREKKESLVVEYLDHLNNSEGIIITGNQGLKVSELEELRTKIRNAEGKYYIVKNTLAKRVLKEANLPTMDDLFKGPVGIGFCHNNIAGVAKAITEFAKGNDNLVIKGGLLGNQVIDQAGVSELVKLPSIHELRSKILGLLNAPASQLVGLFDQPATKMVTVLDGGVRQLVNVVNAYSQKQEEA